MPDRLSIALGTWPLLSFHGCMIGLRHLLSITPFYASSPFRLVLQPSQACAIWPLAGAAAGWSIPLLDSFGEDV